MGIQSWFSGSKGQLKAIGKIVDRVEALEPDIKKLSDAQLRQKTDEFKARLGKGETLSDILPEAFASAKPVFPLPAI